MTDAKTNNELSRLTTLSDDELFGELGDALTESAVTCLNEALAKHGGTPLILDGVSHQMNEYIASDKLANVLTDARELAEARNITLPQSIDIASVFSDDDAIDFVRGS